MESQTGSSVFPIPGDNNSDYEALYQELQTKQQFLLSQISHEIRNPVTLINSFLQLFESHHPEIVKDDCWEKVMENMNFLKALLEEFSSFNNSAKLHLQEINLDHIFRETVESVTPLCQDLGISVTLSKRNCNSSDQRRPYQDPSGSPEPSYQCQGGDWKSGADPMFSKL